MEDGWVLREEGEELRKAGRRGRKGRCRHRKQQLVWRLGELGGFGNCKLYMTSMEGKGALPREKMAGAGL